MHATGSLSSIFCLLCWHLLVYTEFDAQAVNLEETPIDTVTVVGRDAQLNCSFRNLGSETPTWKIEENTRPVKVTSNFTILRPGYSLIGEASIGGYQEYHLLMTNVPLDFGGTYTCTLLGPPGLQHSAEAELKVLENGPICGINPGPTVVSDENESVFSCHINDDLLGDLVWFKNGKEILRGNSSSLEYSTTLQKGDNGAVYNCQYENRDIPSDLWPQLTCVDDIIVDVQYPATVAVTNKTIRPVLEGDKVFALCLITEYGNPEVLQDFYWLGPDGRRASDGLLLIDNVTRQDNGTYICVAENKYYDNSTGRGNVSYDVIVNYVPLVRIEDSSYGKVIEGDVYLASCIVDANPEADIVWSDPYDDIVNNSQTLVITNSAISDAGTYTCHANNTYFNGQTGYGNSSIFVDVQYSPEIDHFNETIVMIEDRNFTIICSADANPLPNVTWKNDTDCLSNGEMLTCVQVQRQQSGVYICEASNRFWNGVTAASSKSFQLIVQYPATVAVTNKTIRPVLEGDKVFALCLITEHGNPEVLQDFYWLGPDGRRASDGLLLIDNVTRQDNGTYICVAENKYYDNSTGRGNVSYDVIVNYVPLVRIEDSSYGKVIEGDIYLASCIVDANPEADIVWSNPYDDIVNNSQTLVITNSAISDAGTYTCHANNTYFNGQIGYGNSSIFVDVQYSPEIDHFNETIVVIEDRNFTIICSADGNPLPNVTWKNNTGCLSNGEMLTCVQVQRQQSGVFICDAFNRFWNGVTAASSKSFQLIVQYPPTLYVLAEHVCKEEDNVSVSCNVRHANPLDVDMWWILKDGKMIPGAHLFLERVSRLDSGNYACIGANTFYDGDRGYGKNTTILDVQYKPEIHLQQSEIRVKEQASVTLACTIDSNPISEDHNWAFNGHVISSELIHTIDWANRSDAGVYNCTAVNTFYDGEQGTGFNITELIVEYIPVVNVQGPESAVVEGAQSSIACTVIDGVPDPYSITLYHINETVNEVQTIENRWVKNHTFDLGVVQRWNDGSYYCVANTSFADGTIESARSKNTELHVHYRPDITNPENEEVTVASGSPVSLHCNADAYPSADITWTKNGEELEPGADDTILHISAVNDSDEGLYVCTAENYVGVDEHEIQLNVNDSEHATQGTPSSSSSGGSPVAIALPCGIVFVVVFVVVLGIVIRRRRRRRKTVEREKPDCGDKFEGDGNAYQEIEFEQVQESNAYSSIEPNPVPERPNSYGDFEYEMPIEVLLEFPKENVHQKSIIGEGTFGKVARAEAWKLAGKEGPTIVALKTLKDNATGEDKKNLLDEFELLKNIGRHKHILLLVGCCTKTDEIYMLFEYMELGNLQDYLRKSRNYIATEYLEAGETSPVLTSGDLIIFAGQVASGMEYLSSKKCVHGDLAARNVMLNVGRICKVTNFGRDLRSHNDAKEGSQRLRWMAPEAIQESELSTKSDVWSFGVVVWEIVTIGHTPYPGMSDNEVKAYLKQGGRMKKPKYCDGDLFLLVMKCWSEKPKRRPKFKEIANEMEEIELDKEVYIDIKSAYEDKIITTE